MLNVISTCRDIICVDINVDKRCVDHSTRSYIIKKSDFETETEECNVPVSEQYTGEM